MLNKEFVLAGKSIFTLEIPKEFQEKNSLKPHYTFKVSMSKDKSVYFLNLLTGPENTSDYTYVGIVVPETGEVRLTKKSAYDEKNMMIRLIRRTLQRVWMDETHLLSDAGFNLHHEGRCGRCGRVLTVPESITTGIGPECRNKMMAG